MPTSGDLKSGDFLFFTSPLPLGNSVTLRGGVWIFSGTTQFKLMSKSNPTAKKVSYWKMNSVDYEKFKSDLCASELLRNTPRHLEDLVNTN